MATAEQTTPCIIVGTMSTSTRDNEPVTITGRIVTNPAPPAPAHPVVPGEPAAPGAPEQPLPPGPAPTTHKK